MPFLEATILRRSLALAETGAGCLGAVAACCTRFTCAASVIRFPSGRPWFAGKSASKDASEFALAFGIKCAVNNRPANSSPAIASGSALIFKTTKGPPSPRISSLGILKSCMGSVCPVRDRPLPALPEIWRSIYNLEIAGGLGDRTQSSNRRNPFQKDARGLSGIISEPEWPG